jgi:Ca2+-binding RTX toxin-like protein
MAIIFPTPEYDDLKHQTVNGSSVERTVDLYTYDTINVPGGATETRVRIHGGNDTVYGNNSDDTIYDNRAINGRPMVGPDGSTSIPLGSGSSGNDTVFAGGGKDTIFAGDGQNYYDGGTETDTVDYSRAGVGVKVDLDTGNGQGSGTGDGVDTLVSIENVTGSRYDDTLTGSAVANVLRGGDGNDKLLGGGAGDTLYGGANDDMLDGGAGADKIYGDDGVDTLVYLFSPDGVSINLANATASGGDAQGDSFKSIENVWGSMYDDTLTGDSGDNVLFGAKGRDVLAGGGGRDRFVYGSPNESTVAQPDIIKAFVHGEDIIDLSGLDNVLTPFGGPSPPSMSFVSRFSGVAGQVTSVVESNATMVYADLDGDKAADFAIKLTGAVQLTASDFWL